MKIDNIPSITTLPGGDNRPARTEAKAADNAGSGVIVADTAAQLHALKSDSQTVNRARVEEIKQAIASGSIVINPANIADGLLDSVVNMLGKGKA